MTDYTELVKSLRYCGDRDALCSLCGRFAPECELKLMTEAADAIEELQEKLIMAETDVARLLYERTRP